jgi:nucleolar protein 56
MNRYLVTRWFGTFLFNTKNIIDKRLFPQDLVQLQTYLNALMNGEILDEERNLMQQGSVTISETRLASLGNYQPDHDFFQSITLDPNSYGFSEVLLLQGMVHLTEQIVKDALSLPDYQVIQMVNAVDELLQTSNLLSERLNSWSVLPTPNISKPPFEQLLASVNAEKDRLERAIENQICNLAPNICSLIGPLLAARLVSSAGSLENLAKRPASSIQLLGAEKALFRFKKEGGKPPKHGVIFQCSLINSAPKKNRGKYARMLSSKIAVAAKADAFTKRDISLMFHNELDNAIRKIKQSTKVKK